MKVCGSSGCCCECEQIHETKNGKSRDKCTFGCFLLNGGMQVMQAQFLLLVANAFAIAAIGDCKFAAVYDPDFDLPHGSGPIGTIRHVGFLTFEKPGDFDSECYFYDVGLDTKGQYQSYLALLGPDWDVPRFFMLGTIALGSLFWVYSLTFCFTAQVRAIRYFMAFMVCVVLATTQGLSFVIFGSDFCADTGCTFGRSAGFSIGALVCYVLSGLSFLAMKDYPGRSKIPTHVRAADIDEESVHYEEKTHRSEEMGEGTELVLLHSPSGNDKQIRIGTSKDSPIVGVPDVLQGEPHSRVNSKPQQSVRQGSLLAASKQSRSPISEQSNNSAKKDPPTETDQKPCDPATNPTPTATNYASAEEKSYHTRSSHGNSDIKLLKEMDIEDVEDKNEQRISESPPVASTASPDKFHRTSSLEYDADVSLLGLDTEDDQGSRSDQHSSAGGMPFLGTKPVRFNRTSSVERDADTSLVTADESTQGQVFTGGNDNNSDGASTVDNKTDDHPDLSWQQPIPAERKNSYLSTEMDVDTAMSIVTCEDSV